MARLTLATHFLQRLTATERGTPERKAVWADIRAEYGIPSDVKIGVETSPTSPHVGQVYIKDTDPRQFIQADRLGRYTAQREVDPPAVAGEAPAAQSPAAQSPAARFTTLEESDPRRTLVKIGKHDLLRAVREAINSGAVAPTRVVVTLEGFPEMRSDTVVLDNRTGDLYLFVLD